eukprot:221938_1
MVLESLHSHHLPLASKQLWRIICGVNYVQHHKDEIAPNTYHRYITTKWTKRNYNKYKYRHDAFRKIQITHFGQWITIINNIYSVTGDHDIGIRRGTRVIDNQRKLEYNQSIPFNSGYHKWIDSKHDLDHIF